MDLIEQYFQEEYIIEKNRIKEIDDLLQDVLKTLKINNKNGWPYELDDQEYKHLTDFSPQGFSFSTNTMILFIIKKFLSKIDKNSPIIPNIEWENIQDFKNNFETNFNTDSSNIINNLVKQCSSKLDESSEKKHIVKSDTFGWNDPLTLSWMAELVIKDKKIFNKIIYNFTDIALEKIKNAFENPNNSILDLELYEEPNKNKRRASNHIFPLLRTIHLFKSLTINNKPIELKPCFFNKKTDKVKIKQQLDIIDGFIHEKLFMNLLNRINEQISFSVVQNSYFDTAELVLSLEGLLLIDDKRKVDETLLTKAFEILKTNQKNNLYWRPLKPFVTSPQGDILLPLSIEIANSLLRICKHLEIKKKYYFHDFFEIFENYTKWLLSNVSQCKIENVEYRGWRSEHVQKLNVIHPWETAQVIIYLMNYKSMLQDRIAYKSLKKSGLSCREKNEKIDWNNKWDVNLNLGIPNCYKEIQDKFIQPRKEKSDTEPFFSMLLYGPPGTGKSSIAEDLADVLGWNLITITPSDFIKHGEADIEGRAKSIFKTLEEQKDCVILFDEIDRLILDRDSNYYSNQGDFYQFMTPSMLVKIKDLRKKERSIFIIATNYEERIDSAIKRSGRIDEKYLVNTLTLEQRKNKIKLFLKNENINLLDVTLKKIVKKTVLYTFIELKTLIKNECKNKNDKKTIETKLLNAINSQEATIKLLNYKRRFQVEKEILNKKIVYLESSIFPYREFFALLFLKLENEEPLYDEEKKLIKRVHALPGFKLEMYFEKGSKIYIKIINYYKTLKN